jgi:hypothetical protein
VSADAVARDVAALRQQGFVIVPDLVPPTDLEVVRRALRPHLEALLLGRNDFEGHRTQRVQALLGYTIHPPFMGHANGLHPRRVLEG